MLERRVRSGSRRPPGRAPAAPAAPLPGRQGAEEDRWELYPPPAPAISSSKKQVGKVTPRLKTCPRLRCQAARPPPRERSSRADSSRLRSLRGVAIAPGLLGTAAVKAPKETSAPRSDTRPKQSL